MILVYCLLEDDKVSTDDVEQKIYEFKDMVEFVDVTTATNYKNAIGRLGDYVLL